MSEHNERAAVERTAPRHGGEDDAAGAMCERPRGLFGERAIEEDEAEENGKKKKARAEEEKKFSFHIK